MTPTTEVAAVVAITAIRTLTFYKSTSLLYHEGFISVPSAAATLWRTSPCKWRPSWRTPTTPSWRRPESAAVPAVLCLYAAATGHVQQPPVCYADAAVLRKYGTAIPWRSCSSSTNVPGTTWGGAVSRVKPFKMLKEERECKLGISVWKKVEVKKFLIS